MISQCETFAGLSLTMHLTQQPFPLVKLLWLLATRQQKAISEFEPLTIRFEQIEPTPVKHHAFSKLFCNPAELPSYVFIDAFRFVGQLLAQSAIPSPLAGMIHLGCQFKLHRAHNWLFPYDIEVSLDNCRDTDKGYLYQLSTRYYQKNKLTLVNENTLIARKQTTPVQASQSSAKFPLPDQLPLLARGEVSRALAWQYARISGDFNPIHLDNNLAKLFGAKRALMHGMYNVHWVLLQLNKQQIQPWQSLQVKFNRPCYLPGKIALHQESDNKFALYSADGLDRYLTLTVRH